MQRPDVSFVSEALVYDGRSCAVNFSQTGQQDFFTKPVAIKAERLEIRFVRFK
jgi:hypothetical protein